MKVYFLADKLRAILPALFCLLISIPTFTSILRQGYFPMHDDLQAVRVYGMSECLKEGQIPCRYTADMGYRFGYPQFNYYGPLPYYLMSVFNLSGVGIFDSVKIGFILSLILGNIAIFYLGKALFKNNFSSALITVLYAYAPYRASDLFSRGAMGEMWAFTFMPLILLFIIKIAEKQNFRNLSLTGLSFALLFASHNISTLIFTPFALMFGALVFGLNHKLDLKKTLVFSKWLIGSVIWGVALSAFFFLPVLLEKRFAHTETMIGGYFDYRAHFVTINQLFFTSFWSYGSSEIGPTDDLSFFFSPVLLFSVVVVSFVVLANFFRRKGRKLSIITLALLAFALLTTFMSHEKSSFLWKLVPLFIYLQFPWRFLVLANFFFILATGLIFVGVEKPKATFLILGFSLITILFSVSFFRPVRWLSITEQEKFSGYLWDRQMTISIFDYLPTSSDTPPNAPAPVLPTSSVREASVEYFKSNATSLSFNYDTKKEVVLKLNRFYFPGWKVYVNGKESDFSYGNDGNMSLILTPGEYKISAALHNTPIRTISNLITLLFIPLTLWLIMRKQHE